MDEIAVPDVLDADRLVVTSRANFVDRDEKMLVPGLEHALRASCAYGQQLWDELNAMRSYLLESLPAYPAENGAPPAASPTGPDDEQGWTNWMAAFASVTSTLCGPHGDGGFGREEADRQARLRRVGV